MSGKEDKNSYVEFTAHQEIATINRQTDQAG